MLDPKQIAATFSEAASGEAAKSFDRLTEKTDTVAKMRVEFFDRIVLLDGGIIALSVTLVGSLASRNPHVALKCVTALALSWVAFVLSMLFALRRNWVEHDRLSKAEQNNYIIALNYSMAAQINLAKAVSGAGSEAEQGLKDVVEAGNTLIKDENKKHATLFWWTKFTGAASLVTMVLGIVLLLLFGVKNILSL